MLDEIPKKWVGGICIHDGKVLLIHRINKERDFNQEYFLFPGGDVEDDENIEESLIRHFQDIGITIQLGDLVHTVGEEGEDELEYYYTSTYVFGEPSVQHEEKEVLDELKQFYTPLWIPLNEIDDIILYPESLKEKMVEELDNQED